ncbi:hypothetical protein [Methylomonas rosea]|uniref:Uncharacterized protein n=1 Tax=Methylomonas rosea TaxID=2952227 RepID=A0ABT1TP68_9GAMM|nr:hypothetical protein [Methylomonas sp. WSC-7]MCQ8116556.1 hypothetical protein [Methylomonas sp. WSC-7]
MQNHVVTVIILILALALYFAGYSGAGNLAFIVGGLFELWFWIRLLGEKTPKSAEPPDKC